MKLTLAQAQAICAHAKLLDGPDDVLLTEGHDEGDVVAAFLTDDGATNLATVTIFADGKVASGWNA